MKKALGDMAEYLQLYRADNEPKALCILVVVGSKKVSNPPRATGRFPIEDAFVPIVVPEGKAGFRINEIIQQSSASTVYGELLASHAFAHAENQDYLALRARTTQDEREFGELLLGDKGWEEYSPVANC